MRTLLLCTCLCLVLSSNPARCDNEEEDTYQSEFGEKIDRIHTTPIKRENAKPSVRPLDPMQALQNLIKAKSMSQSGLPPGVVIKPGASMGLGALSFGNITLDPNNLKIDKKLLTKIKQLMPGVGNVEDIQDQLNGMLFGASTKEEEAATTSSEVVEVKPKEAFVPSVPDSRFNRKRVRDPTSRSRTTAPPTTTTTDIPTPTTEASTTTATSTTDTTTTTNRIQAISKRKSQPIIKETSSSNKVVVDGDRAEYDDYDYRDYDLYAYSDDVVEGRQLGKDTSEDEEDLMPLAAEQRQRRPTLQRRRFGPGPNVGPRSRPNSGFGPGRIRGRRRKVGGRRAELDLDDVYEDYRAPSIQDIPGRIQGLPHDNIGALDEELILNEDYEDQYISQLPFNSGQSRRPTRPEDGTALASGSFGPQSPIAPANSPNVDCDFYTTDLCIDVSRYPSNEIVGLLSKNRRVGADLIADVVDQSADNLVDGVTAAQENRYTFAHYYGNRRDDGANHVHRDFAQEGGFLCPSEIKYAKPKRGKTAQGVWKDIVNVNDYTQTLRMEKCLKPGGGCSYVSHHYKSQCSQVYNYHRLLSWDKARGLHMDIYKVPTCCSCHIMGYSYIYPPLNTPAGRTGELTQELFQSSPITPAVTSQSQQELPEVQQNNEFQKFINQVSNNLPFKHRDGPVSDPGASSPIITAARPPPPSVPGPPPPPPPPRVRPRPNQQQRRPGPGSVGRPPSSKLIPPRRRIDEGTSPRKNPLQRLMDQNFFGSEVIETAVAPPPEMFNKNDLLNNADVKYQGIPIYDDDVIEGKADSLVDLVSQESDEGEEGSTQKSEQPAEKERNQDNSEQPKSLSVNYGYHPIIDFFDRYRFDAAA